MIRLNNDWHFVETWSEAFLTGLEEGTAVRLPHTNRELPLHYADPKDYAAVCGYRRALDIPEKYAGKRLFLQFDGAAHIATVYINGTEAATHRCGYTAFRVEITDLVVCGGENTVCVKLDATENGEIPPFGFVIDYLTYGGVYRDVWLDVREQSYLEDVFAFTPGLDLLEARLTIRGDYGWTKLQVLDAGRVLVEERGHDRYSCRVPRCIPWSPDCPKLYTLRVELYSAAGVLLDTHEHAIGFRTLAFKADGFYLNGKKSFLRGLNRHQSYPIIGYAAPESLQREDARILKEELACTAVRTSHYPQSQYFIDECDRLGLMVFTEIPGWQHIGDEAWKDQAVENVREMVLQYRNHPSIVLWGVRINESQDDDELYRRTNALCHQLDPSRATSGVRYLLKSHLLEDVYAYNDFSHDGTNPGCRPKDAVTTDMSKALLISECNGHMFPTKPCDNWERRQEQALRHARVQNAAAADGAHAGCFGWCMFDYATHKDFGSGDRICYHGVLDSFRNPKLAAALYASQGDTRPVLELGSTMDIGDFNGGLLGTPPLFTNTDEVRFYKNDVFVRSYRSEGWDGLKHGPITVDDLVGELLETQEGFEKPKAALLHRCLVAAGKNGPDKLPAVDKAILRFALAKYHMSYGEFNALYGKYVGNWGGASTVWRFDAVKDGTVVLSRTFCPSSELQLEVTPSAADLTEGSCYDMAAVRIRVLDGNGNLAPYAQLPLRVQSRGPIEIVGPHTITAEGGMTGLYVRTTGRVGKASLRISAEQCPDVTVSFTVKA